MRNLSAALRQPRNSRSRRTPLVAAIAAASASPASHAVERFWGNPAGGNYATPANWMGGVVPAAADGAHFDLGAAYNVVFSTAPTNLSLNVHSDQPTFNLNGFTYTLTASGTAVGVGVDPGDQGALALANGTLATSNSNGNVLIGVGASSSANLTLNNNARLSAGGSLSVGHLATGFLVLNSGTASANRSVVGNGVNGNGQVHLSGSNAAWITNTTLTVGAVGKGLVLTQPGSTISAGNAIVGGSNGGDGTVSLFGNGTTFTTTNALDLATGPASKGSINLSSGARLSHNGGAFGGAASAMASLTLSGATWNSFAFLQVGRFGGSALIHSTDSAITTTGVALGFQPGGTTVARVIGSSVAESSWTNAGSFTIGLTGEADLQILNSRLQTTNGILIGSERGSVGRATIDEAAVATVSGTPITVGRAGDGSLLIAGASAVSASAVIVGDLASGQGSLTIRGNNSTLGLNAATIGDAGRATVRVIEGATLDASGNVALGAQPGSFADVLVTGQSSSFATGTLFIGGVTAAGAGHATLTVGPGASASGVNNLALQPTGTINLDGGRISAAALVNNGGAFNFNSGTLNLTNPASTFTIGAAGQLGNTLHLTQARAVNATNITFIAADGLLLLEGGTYNANNTVQNAGEIHLHHPASRLAGPGLLNNSGLVTGDGRIDARLSNLAAGEIRADPGDRLRFTSPATNAGVINLAGGTLEFSGGLSNQTAGRILGRGALHFDAGLTNAGQLQLSAGLTDVHGSINSVAGSKIIVTGQATATFYNNLTLAPGAEFRISTNSAAVFFGNVTGSSNFTGAGAKYFEGGAVASLAVLDSPGSTTVETGATLTADRIRETSLTVNGTVTLRPNGAPANASKVNTLTINPGGELDLANNALLIDYVPSEPSPINQVRNDLLTGALTTSSSITNPNTTLAYGEAPALFDFSTGPVTYGDLTLDPTTLFIKLAIKGDANLDGKVSFPDLVALAQNYNTTTGNAVWTTGDFTYDGNVTFPDLVLLAQNYNTTLLAAPIPGSSPGFEDDFAKALAQVPEPSLVSPLAFLAYVLTGRSRRSRLSRQLSGATQLMPNSDGSDSCGSCSAIR